MSEGITDTQEVKRALKHYTLHVLCITQKPELTNRAYFTTGVDIRNHIYKAQQACQLSKLDQENLKIKIDMWQKENPESRFHFCPYKAKASESKEVKEHVIDNELCKFTQTLLYVHQEPWQQQLLKRYGNTISLMDTTLFLVKDTKPRFHRARPVPFTLKSHVEEAHDQLEADCVLEKVTHSDWAAPTVTVPKRDGSIRLCGDYKVTVNPVLDVDKYPLPRPERYLRYFR